MIIENKDLRNKYQVFKSRVQAGEFLSNYLTKAPIDLVLGIPNGGVPVVYGLCSKIQIPEINLFMIKKIQLPHTTEAGFGAVTPDGKLFLNSELMEHYQLTENQVKQQVKNAQDGIEQRLDGIASGYSMIAACNWLKDKEAKKVIIAVPTAPLHSLNRIEHLTDKIICLNIRTGFHFAVADAYKRWYDVPNDEAKKYLEKIMKS
ncbi:MAG: phosphoribosyltransferase [Candidatus Kariarchaeaceae archaeon]|jgi:predicted phosphoribosyltransferase